MAADTPRYKAIGNAMAVPCMAWLGQRLLASLNNAHASIAHWEPAQYHPRKYPATHSDFIAMFNAPFANDVEAGIRLRLV